jgi:plastocyanin
MASSVSRWVRLLLAAAGATLICGAATAGGQEPIEVRMRNNLYDPASLTVPAGTSVRFVNLDSDIHTVSQKGGGFESGLMFNRDTWTFVFNTPGTYEYFCLPHPFMVATITVQ